MLLPERLRLCLAFAAALPAALAGAQTVQIGNNVASPNGSDVAVADVRTDIDLVRPASATGVVDSASF